MEKMEKRYRLMEKSQHIYAPLKVGDNQLKCDEDFTLSMWINPSKTSYQIQTKLY